MAKGQTPGAADPRLVNLQNRNLVLAHSLEMQQIIFQTTLSGTPGGQVINIPVRNVGLIKKFLVLVEFDLAQSAAETLNRTKLGPSNILSQVVFNDMSNQQRISTPGWHLHLLATARRKVPFGAAYTTDSPVAIGSNLPVMNAPAAVTTSQHIRQFYEVPLAFSDYDLRGAMFAGVLNATSTLQLTVNPSIVAASTADSVLSAYQSTTGATGTITNFKVTVYQVYLDQLPSNGGVPILPMLDLGTAYMLNQTVFTGFAVGQDNPIPFANMRDFLSTILIIDQNGTLNKGTDINNFSLTSANYTNIFKKEVFGQALETRNLIGDDFPDGSYYFDFRNKPISTVNYGNMQLNVNPSSFAANATVLVGFEAMSAINMVTMGGSLPGN